MKAALFGSEKISNTFITYKNKSFVKYDKKKLKKSKMYLDMANLVEKIVVLAISFLRKFRITYNKNINLPTLIILPNGLLNDETISYEYLSTFSVQLISMIGSLIDVGFKRGTSKSVMELGAVVELDASYPEFLYIVYKINKLSCEMRKLRKKTGIFYFEDASDYLGNLDNHAQFINLKAKIKELSKSLLIK